MATTSAKRQQLCERNLLKATGIWMLLSINPRRPFAAVQLYSNHAGFNFYSTTAAPQLLLEKAREKTKIPPLW
jgi:predicted membrane-bound dolichyl-phosphate-mannose-protein mannosyltransferase